MSSSICFGGSCTVDFNFSQKMFLVYLFGYLNLNQLTRHDTCDLFGQSKVKAIFMSGLSIIILLGTHY
jgi:hypothetical protein